MELVACIPLLNHPSKLKPTKLNHQLPASEFAQNPPLQCLHQSHNQTRHSHPIKSSNWPSSSTLIFASSHWTAKSPIKSSCELPPLSLVQPHTTPLQTTNLPPQFNLLYDHCTNQFITMKNHIYPPRGTQLHLSSFPAATMKPMGIRRGEGR